LIIFQSVNLFQSFIVNNLLISVNYVSFDYEDMDIKSPILLK